MIDISNLTSLITAFRNETEKDSISPEWHNSDTAKLFSPPKFINLKTNKGYWF